MKYITNKELINKLQQIDLFDFDLSNKDLFLSKKVLNQFIDLIAVNDINDNSNAPFEIPLNFIDNFEYNDLIQEIAETCTPQTYSQLTAWLAYDNEHIRLIEEYYANTFQDDYKGINLVNIISNTITNALKQDLLSILTNITK